MTNKDTRSVSEEWKVGDIIFVNGAGWHKITCFKPGLKIIIVKTGGIHLALPFAYSGWFYWSGYDFKKYGCGHIFTDKEWKFYPAFILEWIRLKTPTFIYKYLW